jgi:C4-dicarboxylate-specific signal transduction histidine kinase
MNTPTADAYERACAALNRHRDRAEQAEAALAQALQAQKALVEKIEALPRIVPSELSPDEQWQRNGEYVSVAELDQCLALTRQTEKDQEYVARVDSRT